MSTRTEEISRLSEDVLKGGRPKYHEANAAKGKIFARTESPILSMRTHLSKMVS